MEPAPEPEQPGQAARLLAPPAGPGNGTAYPDPSSWLHDGNEALFAFLAAFESEAGRGALADDERQLGAGALRSALGEKLRADEGWEMNEGDWEEVGDLVQHYTMLRGLRRPPFWDTRPIVPPAPSPSAAGASGTADAASLPVVSPHAIYPQ